LGLQDKKRGAFLLPPFIEEYDLLSIVMGRLMNLLSRTLLSVHHKSANVGLVGREQVWVTKIYQYPATIFANNNFFVGTYIKLPLRRDLVKASATCITLDCNHSQTIPCIGADLLISNNQTLFY
jgi:hypothetical protein